MPARGWRAPANPVSQGGVALPGSVPAQVSGAWCFAMQAAVPVVFRCLRRGGSWRPVFSLRGWREPCLPVLCEESRQGIAAGKSPRSGCVGSRPALRPKPWGTTERRAVATRPGPGAHRAARRQRYSMARWLAMIPAPSPRLAYRAPERLQSLY